MLNVTLSFCELQDRGPAPGAEALCLWNTLGVHPTSPGLLPSLQGRRHLLGPWAGCPVLCPGRPGCQPAAQRGHAGQSERCSESRVWGVSERAPRGQGWGYRVCPSLMFDSPQYWLMAGQDKPDPKLGVGVNVFSGPLFPHRRTWWGPTMPSPRTGWQR